jgi:hypothetical protein
LTEKLAARLTTKSPQVQLLRINERETPAVARWLESKTLTLGDLFRSPQNRELHVPATALLLVRGKKHFILPDESTSLRPKDEIVIAARQRALRSQTEVIYDDSTLHYVITGQQIPTSWIGQWASRQRQRQREKTQPASPTPEAVTAAAKKTKPGT